jgi:hypothetical protein
MNTGFDTFACTTYISSNAIHFEDKPSSSRRTLRSSPNYIRIAFSLPTFLVYLACFYFLSKQDMNYVISKIILIAVAVLGIYITQIIIKGTMSQEIIIAYSVTAIIVGLILRIRNTK